MRKVSLITIAVVFELALSITSCETTITTSQNAAKNTQKAIDDANRQDGIKEDYNRDNFDFNQFDVHRTYYWAD